MLSFSHIVSNNLEKFKRKDWPLSLDMVFLLHVLTEPDPSHPNFHNVARKMGGGDYKTNVLR